MEIKVIQVLHSVSFAHKTVLKLVLKLVAVNSLFANHITIFLDILVSCLKIVTGYGVAALLS